MIKLIATILVLFYDALNKPIFVMIKRFLIVFPVRLVITIIGIALLLFLEVLYQLCNLIGSYRFKKSLWVKGDTKQFLLWTISYKQKNDRK